MSDLQCPATLLVARDGHAAYAPPGLLTDDGGWLTDVGATQMVVLAERLAADPSVRISAVYSSPLARSVQSGRLVSDALGVPHEIVGGLEERAVGELAGQQVGNAMMAQVMHAWTTGDLSAAVPGGEDGYQVVRRARQAMESIADQHRDSPMGRAVSDVLAGRRPLRDLQSDPDFMELTRQGVQQYRDYLATLTPEERERLQRQAEGLSD